jgi:hypothetical protein
MYDNSMKSGFVAFVDILGYKGIWQEAFNPVERLINLRRATNSTYEDFMNDLTIKPLTKKLNFQFCFFSDTIAIFSETINSEDNTSSQVNHSIFCLLGTILQSINYTVIFYLNRSVRGVVTYGKYYAEDVFIMGPAVDEAANCQPIADAATIWTTSSTNKFLSEHVYSEFDLDTLEYINYDNIDLNNIKGVDSLLPWVPTRVPIRDKNTPENRDMSTLALCCFDENLKRAGTEEDYINHLKYTFCRAEGDYKNQTIQNKLNNTLKIFEEQRRILRQKP